jgi:hypothetical protein
MTDPTLTGWLETIWSHLTRGVADRRHPARHPTLATIGPDGPEARTLVLRGACQAEGRLTLHTDAQSPKAAQIAADPRVALHVWLPKPRLQLRLGARATLGPGAPALFDALPPEAQANYGGAAPGTPLPASGPPPDLSRFLEITCTLHRIDALSLATSPHRRALYRRDDSWRGAWIAA